MTSDPPAVATGTEHRDLPRSTEDEISLWEVLAVLLRRLGTVVVVAVLSVGAAVAFTLLRAETFTTAASFRPQGSEASASEVLALASQFGVSVPGAGAEEASPAFYAELITSREILFRAASKTYVVAGIGSAALADLLEIDEDSEELRLEETIEALREDHVSVATGRETGIVTLSVRTEWPDLSQAIATRLLDEISRFNLDTRQSQAAAERAFIEERVDSAQFALESAESAMRGFLQSNRQWENSPELTFQRDRLQRDITLRQQVYTTLVQSFEQARISEVRDTPVITVLQAPFLPPGPDERSLLVAIAVGIALGGMGGVVLAFVMEAFGKPSSGDPAREDFRRSWESVVGAIPFVGGRSA